jgi:hypothetical protein
MLLRKLSVVVVICLWPWLASATMYKYVDEKGRTVYSQSPPPSGQAEIIKPPPPPASSGEPAPQAVDGTDRPETDAAAGPDRQADQRKAESRRIKAENCTRSRKLLDMYRNPQNRLLKTSDGLYERITDEKRQQGMDEAQKNVQEFCN